MANYNGVSRTNYFQVTDEERYAHLFKGITGSEDEVLSFDKETPDGTVLHGFGAYGGLLWSPAKADGEEDWEDYDDTDSFDTFLTELQKILPDGEAFVLMETGHEKLRYLTGYFTVATNKDVRYGDLTTLAREQARTMLNDKDWRLNIEY